MNQSNHNSSARRSVAYVSTLGTTQLHLRNPLVVAFWSVALPGLGHLILSKHLRGFFLFTWEVLVNYKAHINHLLYYSLIGDFESARNVVDIRWMSLYIPTYIFAIWDSYRTAIDLNHNYILAAREDAEIKPFKLDALSINYLDKRNPWVSVAWSLLAPGTGQLCNHRIISAFFVIIWWVIICCNSKLLLVLHYTVLGDFNEIKAVVDMHWFLNIPSIYFFAMYDAYVNTVENNKLYDWEQTKFLKRDYQNQRFQMPLRKHIKGKTINNCFGQNKEYRGDKMYIVSTFEHSVYLELAVTAIQMKGIPKDDILAIPMDKRSEKLSFFDSLHHSDGLSIIDLPIIFATLFGIFGSIYGTIFKWGPLLWGLIGILMGSTLGLLIKLSITKKYNNRQSNKKSTEVVLIIRCKEIQLEIVKDTLWSHHALGVSKLDLDDSD